MNDELDPGLRRLFASTAENPNDEAFVQAVTARTSRGRWIALIAPGLAMTFVLAVVAIALGLVLDQSAQVISPLVGASPMGRAAGLGLVIAGAVCYRLLAPILGLRRS
jgi:hypothetical protein